MDIQWAQSPNYQAGRKGKQPIAIVNHITAGLMPGTLSWLKNPVAQASAHYLVTKAGKIIQLVKDEDTAWHAGIVNKPNWPLYDSTNPNYYTLGIEHEALAGEALTEEQYQATLWLHRQLVDKWRIPVDRNHIIGHYRIDGVNRPNDPGSSFPWERLSADLKGGSQVPEWMKKIMQDAKEAGLITSDHNPLEPATKWFVLAVALKILTKMGRLTKYGG
jgi:N-acetyl-anhydromuramyl-L-alanine amidase AmpD